MTKRELVDRRNKILRDFLGLNGSAGPRRTVSYWRGTDTTETPETEEPPDLNLNPPDDPAASRVITRPSAWDVDGQDLQNCSMGMGRVCDGHWHYGRAWSSVWLKWYWTAQHRCPIARRMLQIEAQANATASSWREEPAKQPKRKADKPRTIGDMMLDAIGDNP